MPFMAGLRKTAGALKPKRPVEPVTQMGPEAVRRNVESLFDVPEPYRSMALDIDDQMREIERLNGMNEPMDGLLWPEQVKRAVAEQDARNKLYELAVERDKLLEGPFE